MARHRASPVTVQRAIAALAAEGAARAAARARHLRGARAAGAGAARPLVAGGRPRRRRASRRDALHELLAVPPPGAIPLSSGYLSLDLQPLHLVGAALARAARRPGAWERGPVEGREELRAWFAREAGGSLRAHDVVVCSGGQPALATAFRALARARRPGAGRGAHLPGRHRRGPRRRAARRPRPQRRRRRAPRPARPGASRAPGARLVYCQPLYANPHGSVLAADRRAAVLDAVAGAGAFLHRGRLGARPERRGRPAAAAGRRRSPTATSSTCAR